MFLICKHICGIGTSECPLIKLNITYHFGPSRFSITKELYAKHNICSYIVSLPGCRCLYQLTVLLILILNSPRQLFWSYIYKGMFICSSDEPYIYKSIEGTNSILLHENVIVKTLCCNITLSLLLISLSVGTENFDMTLKIAPNVNIWNLLCT